MEKCWLFVLLMLTSQSAFPQPCGPYVEDPRALIRSAGMFFLGTVESVSRSRVGETAIVNVEVVWQGDVEPGDSACIPLPRDLCLGPGVTPGERYVMWAGCAVDEVQARKGRGTENPCKAQALLLRSSPTFLDFALSNAPELTREELQKHLHAWLEQTESSEAFSTWVAFAKQYRDFSDWNAKHQSLLLEIFEHLQLGQSRPSTTLLTRAGRNQDRFYAGLLEMLAAEGPTTAAELARWRELKAARRSDQSPQ